jgi:hypothetical protein
MDLSFEDVVLDFVDDRAHFSEEIARWKDGVLLAVCSFFHRQEAYSLETRRPRLMATRLDRGSERESKRKMQNCRTAKNVPNDYCTDDDMHYFEEDKWMSCTTSGALQIQTPLC